MAWFLGLCFSLAVLGSFRSETSLTLRPRDTPARHLPAPTAGEGARSRASAAPGGLSGHPGRTRPGSRSAPGLAPGGETGRQEPPILGGSEGDRGSNDARASVTPRRIGSDSVGAAGSGRQPEGGSGVAPGAQERSPPTADALDPALGLSGPGQTPAWENPGPFPGAAALPGRAGEGIPGICPETAVASLGRIRPYMDSASAASAGKAPARTAGTGRACALSVSPPGILPQGTGRLGRVPALDFPTPGIRGRVEAWTPELGLLNTWAEGARGHRYRSEQ